VTIVDDLLTEPTAELAVGLLLALDRSLVAGDAHVRQGRHDGWRPQFYGWGLTGRTVGIVGFGRVGRAIARRLLGMGMRVIYTDPNPHDAESLASPRSLSDLMQESDAIVMAAPYSPAGAIIGAEELQTLRPGALLVNVGRGSTVDEDAIVHALTNGKLRGYAADVFAFEDRGRPEAPLGPPPALLALSDRTVFTPHLGSAVVDARDSIEVAAATSIVAALLGEEPPGAVNLVSSTRQSDDRSSTVPGVGIDERFPRLSFRREEGS
jgi:phosphonate dehydrogenase